MKLIHALVDANPELKGKCLNQKALKRAFWPQNAEKSCVNFITPDFALLTAEEGGYRECKFILGGDFMKKTICGLLMVLVSSSALAESMPSASCSFGIGPMVYFKTSFTFNSLGVTSGQLSVSSADDQQITTLPMAPVATQGTTNSAGRLEVVRMKLTANSTLPDAQYLVMYQSTPADKGAIPAALLFSPNAVSSIIAGSCTYTYATN